MVGGSLAARIAAQPRISVGTWRLGPTQERIIRRTSQGVIAALILFLVALWLGFNPFGWRVGYDQWYFGEITHRWLQTGQFYWPEQLAGPYHVIIQRSNLYPPLALYLFVPFQFLPSILWYLIPSGTIAYAIWRLRPGTWAWAAMALILVWPYSLTCFAYGNTTMWTTALYAAGFLWGWPSPLLAFKPSALPFALAGIRRRSWWIALGVVALSCLPLGGLWLDYIAAMRNADVSPTYALSALPLILLPLVAWLGRTSKRRTLPADPRAT